MKGKILIVCHISTFFTELYRTAMVIKESKSYEPIFLFHKYPTANRDITCCLSQNIRCINDYGNTINLVKAAEATKNNPTSNRSSFLWRKLFSRIPFYHVLINIRRFKKLGKKYGRVISQLSPKLILLAGDQVDYDSSVIIQQGHTKNVASLLMPSTMSDGLEQAEVYYYQKSHHITFGINMLASLLFPRWIRTHKGRRLLRTNGSRLLAMELLQLAPPLPWIFNSGNANAIAVESPAMQTYYNRCGLPDNQLKLTGSPAGDILHKGVSQKKSFKKELCVKLGLDETKPIIVTALPPDSLYMEGGRPECDFRVYRDLINFWVDSLALLKSHNTIISLHPSVDYDEMKYLEKEHVKIAQDDIVNLIPLCDIFVASVSSTIRWAIACNKPVVNYDVYRYRYTDFINIAGILIMEEKQDFLEILKKLTEDDSYYLDLKQEQKEDAQKWGLTDGLCGKRILDLIDNLT